MPRNYDKEAAYKAKPSSVKKRSMNNQARRIWEKEKGPIPAGMDVDHIKPLSQGGTNAISNLRLRSQHDNRSYDRDGPGGKPVVKKGK